MGYQEISDKLEKQLQNKLGCKFNYLLMRFKQDENDWIVEGTASTLKAIKAKFYQATTDYGPKSIIEVIPYPTDFSKLNSGDISKYPDQMELTKLIELREASEMNVNCEDETCTAYQLEQNNEWLLEFIDKYLEKKL